MGRLPHVECRRLGQRRIFPCESQSFCFSSSPPALPPQEPAEVVFVNGRFITLDEATPEVEAIAVRNERIVAVGTREEIDKHRGDGTEVVDLEGLTVVPGLIDAHEHFPAIGKRVQQVFLDETKSAAEALEIVKRELEKLAPGEWLVGQGWHTVAWNGSDYPGKEELTRISPDNPVYLVGMASHAAWVNAKALELAGITKDTPDPPGGQDPEAKRHRRAHRDPSRGSARPRVAAPPSRNP